MAPSRPSAPHAAETRRAPSRSLTGLIASLVFLAAIFGALALRSALRGRALVKETIPNLSVSLERVRESLRASNLNAAASALLGAGSEAVAVGEKAEADPLLGSVAFIRNGLGGLRGVGEALVSLGRGIEFLQTNAFSLLMKGGGDRLIAALSEVRLSLASLREQGSRLSQQAATLSISGMPSEDWGSLSVAEQFMGALVSWLSQEEPRHLLILFQNQTEIRPGGGFVGSFADVTLAQGSLDGMRVYDIYDPDGQLEAKVIPPEPLQRLTKNWGARDANWFFDFPASAKKVISFLERSKIFSERGVRFDAALALNLNAVARILEATGPLALPEYGLTLTSENALDEIQREVRAGGDRREGEPKRILTIAAPRLLERLAAISETETAALWRILGEEVQRKNIMAYFNDPLLQSFLVTAGVAGDELDLTARGAEDYLAVFEANVAGGKTDAVIARSLSLMSRVSAAGDIDHTLVLTRRHRGDEREEPWYRSRSTTYLQVLAPWGSRLIARTGGEERAIAPLADYRTYETDEDLRTLEQGDGLRGKTSFRTWLTLSAGDEQTFRASYRAPNRARVEDGGRYVFTYETQSGMVMPFSWKVEAPPGFIWKESGSALFAADYPDPLRRTTITLTLTRGLRVEPARN